MALDITEMHSSYWEQVRRIYLEGLATGLASFQTEAPTWEQWDASHHTHSRLVVKDGDQVVAWAALSPVSQRACYRGVSEFSIYIAESHRGQKVGKRLLLALIDSSERNGIWTLYGSTFPENEASIRLQVSCGFRVIGRRERIAQHYGIWRDTIITERRSNIVGVDDNGALTGRGDR
jgi:L-amino acid N-acyltransferase YncA